MIEVAPTMNAAVMAAWGARMGAAAKCYVFGGVRAANVGTAPAGAPVCIIELDNPAGTVNGTTGNFDWAESNNVGSNGQITNAVTPTWARFYDDAGIALCDMDARLVGATNNGEEVILAATGVNVGAFIRIVGGSIGV